MTFPHFRHASLCCALLALAACARNEHAASVETRDFAAAAPAMAAADMPAMATGEPIDAADSGSGGYPQETAPPEPSQLASSAATYNDPQRKFIRTAQARFQVKDVYKSALAIEDLAAAQGGFVVRNDITSQNLRVRRFAKGDGKRVELIEYSLQGNLTIRVPSDNTQAFLRSLVSQMEFLDSRSFAAEDAQFDLLRQYLQQKRNQEAQQELGQATQQGGKLGDKAEAIAARNQARAGRDDALVEQRKFEDQVAFSTIQLSLYQPSQVRRSELNDVDEVFAKSGPGFFSRLGHSLCAGWNGLLTAIVALATLWPLWLALLIPAMLLVRYFRRKKQH